MATVCPQPLNHHDFVRFGKTHFKIIGFVRVEYIIALFSCTRRLDCSLNALFFGMSVRLVDIAFFLQEFVLMACANRAADL